MLRIIVGWIVGFVVVLLLLQIFAPAVVDTFFTTLGELL